MNNQWILCKDRLPENSDAVLVSVEGCVYIGSYDYPVYFDGLGDSKRWCDDEMQELDGVDGWMPLPQPLKHEEI